MIAEDSELFEFFSRQFGLVCFRVKGKEGRSINKLTERVIDQIRNIE